ncbi:MAG TPA: hypothetical protein PLU49_10320 [Saprospiraceae bacterium]|nr:hypothetical protein [Saprospiraceae bacterium]
MNEQNYKDIMDKLADKGWADMEKKLNASMPAENKKTRRIFPFLIFMLIFIAAGVAVGYWMFTTDQVDQTPEKPLPEISLDYALQNAEDRTSKEKVLLDENLSDQKSLTINDLKLSEKQSKLGAGSSQKPAANLNKNARVSKNQSLNKMIALSENEKVYLVEGKMDENSMELKVDYSTEEFIAKTDMNDVIELNTLVNKYFEPKFSDEQNFPDYKLLVMPMSFSRFGQQSPCDHGLTFQSGMISENLASYGGFEVGIGYKKYLGGHIYLSSTLNYKILNKNYFSNALMRTGIFNISGLKTESNSTDWVEERYSYELQNAEIRNNTIGYEYVLGLVKQLHYLEIPFQIGYQWKQLGLFGGINVSWLIFGSNAVRDLTEQYFNTIVLSDEVLFNKQMLNRFDLSPQLGIEYKLWHGLTLYSHYNHGLIQIAKAESASEFKNAEFSDKKGTASSVRIDRNRYFSLGLKYELPLCSLR